MAVPRELRAVVGQAILPTWRALLNWIDRTGIIRGPGVRLRVTNAGTYVWADSDYKPWDHPFRVSMSGGLRVIIEPGLVNGVSPYIGDINISGEDEKAPQLEIEPASGRSYIALKADPTLGADGTLTDTPESLSLVHLSELPDGNLTDDVAHYPVALLRWNRKGKVKGVFQITHHNLNHVWIGGDPGAGIPPRHLFWAA